MASSKTKQQCYAAAMRMLARREHSVFELTQKLSIKEFSLSDISDSIDSLIKQNYQSDERFATEFIQMRFNQGKGPIKISIDLKQRGIEDFDLSEFDFYTLAKEIRTAKFSSEPPVDYKEKAKQQRFLQSRGFEFDQINQSFV